MLTETRILLPGTEIFVAFLATLPFSHRFPDLASLERGVYLATFLTTMVALICFVTPAAYHRVARPIHHKAEFKRFVSRILVVGLVPVSLSLVLATFLVTSMASGRSLAYTFAGVMAVVVVLLWWVIPLVRAHDRLVVQRPVNGTRKRPRNMG